MGVWATPFESTEAAQQFAKLLKKPLVGKSRNSKVYSVVGCDELFDQLEETEKEADFRPAMVAHVRKWCKKLECFAYVDEDAVPIVTEAMDKFDGKKTKTNTLSEDMLRFFILWREEYPGMFEIGEEVDSTEMCEWLGNTIENFSFPERLPRKTKTRAG